MLESQTQWTMMTARFEAIAIFYNDFPKRLTRAEVSAVGLTISHANPNRPSAVAETISGSAKTSETSSI